MICELRCYGNCPHCQEQFYFVVQLHELDAKIDCICGAASCGKRFVVWKEVLGGPARMTNTGNAAFTSPPMATEFRRVS